MFGKKTHLCPRLCRRPVRTFTNGTLMATAYAADQGTEATAPCYGVNSAKGPIGLQVWEPRLRTEAEALQRSRDLRISAHSGARLSTVLPRRSKARQDLASLPSKLHPSFPRTTEIRPCLTFHRLPLRALAWNNALPTIRTFRTSGTERTSSN